ncbi:hypothetical protein Ae201684P_003080 [Aphanomyces euteiches]|nr:hypothetical protein Ae201684P_003080 [Aphanomyces euteiches]
MVVSCTKHQRGPKATREYPKHTPQDASPLVFSRLMTCRSRPHEDAHLPRLARLKGVMVVWCTKHQRGPKATREYPTHATRCISTRVFSPDDPLATCRSRPHEDAHLPRLARLKGVMVVWCTKHQRGPKATREYPTHTPQDASPLVFSRLMTHLPRADLDRPHEDAHLPRLARLKGVMVVWCTKHQRGPKATREYPTHTPQDASPLVFSRLMTHLPRADLDPMKTPTCHVCHV